MVVKDQARRAQRRVVHRLVGCATSTLSSTIDNSSRASPLRSNSIRLTVSVFFAGSIR